MKSIDRQALYQGYIPITQHGWKCEDCGTEWWPAFPGSNEGCYPVSHVCDKKACAGSPDEENIGDCTSCGRSNRRLDENGECCGVPF